MFGARFGCGRPIAGAVHDLAHTFEPPVGPVEPSSPSGGGGAGRNAWEAELELMTEGESGLAVGFKRRIHSFFVLLCQRGLDNGGPTDKNVLSLFS